MMVEVVVVVDEVVLSVIEVRVAVVQVLLLILVLVLVLVLVPVLVLVLVVIEVSGVRAGGFKESKPRELARVHSASCAAAHPS